MLEFLQKFKKIKKFLQKQLHFYVAYAILCGQTWKSYKKAKPSPNKKETIIESSWKFELTGLIVT